MKLKSATVHSFLPASSNGRIASTHVTSDSPICPTYLFQPNDTISFKLSQLLVMSSNPAASTQLQNSRQNCWHIFTRLRLQPVDSIFEEASKLLLDPDLDPPCFVFSDNLRQKAVFLLMITSQMTQKHSSIVLFGGQLVENPLRTIFSKDQVLMHYAVSGAYSNTE
ncbi:hypothetical protein TNCV_1772631 [Trichonephila clavipes]|nr:hypothetical protein TNCV_1772631 [Trichonephila clavipes]